ncbi:hypothetical protein [Flavobacterium columnare]
MPNLSNPQVLDLIHYPFSNQLDTQLKIPLFNDYLSLLTIIFGKHTPLH